MKQFHFTACLLAFTQLLSAQGYVNDPAFYGGNTNSRGFSFPNNGIPHVLPIDADQYLFIYNQQDNMWPYPSFGEVIRMQDSLGTVSQFTVCTSINTYEQSKIMDIRIDVSGKLLVLQCMQNTQNNPTNSEMALSRYVENGNGTFSPDNTFGTSGGHTTLASVSQHFYPKKVTQLSDSSYAVWALTSEPGNSSTLHVTLLKFTPAGNLDVSFGSNGYIVYPFYNHSANSIGDVRPLPNDEHLISAQVTELDSYTNLLVTHPVIARIQANGNIDSTFGSNGKPWTEIELGTGVLASNLSSIDVDANGKIIVGGSGWYQVNMNSYNPIAGAARLHTDGSIDNSFGTAGILSHDFGCFASISTLKAMSDGSLLAAGQYNDNCQNSWRSAFFHITANGAFDTTINGNGISYNQISKCNISHFEVLGNGKILCGGSYTFSQMQTQSFIARLTLPGMDTENEKENSTFQVYPNPATDLLTVQLETPQAIEIWTPMGSLLASCASQSVYTLDISGYAPGIYFLRSGNQTRQFIKY